MPIKLHGTYYTATEAAEKLGYRDHSYLCGLCKAGKIPAIKVGTVWLIHSIIIDGLNKKEVKGQGSRGIARK